MSRIESAYRYSKWLASRVYDYLKWKLKRGYRWATLIAGPGLFLLFGALQVHVIGEHLADRGWHWCPGWPVAAVIGYTPFLGSLVSAKVAADVGWMELWCAVPFFLTPFWLFAVLTALPLTLGPPARRALRLLRASKPWRPGSARGT
jgi:hypothetical protein